MTAEQEYIAIDIGGTSIKAAQAFSFQGQISLRETIVKEHADNSINALIDSVRQLVAQLCNSPDIPVAIATTGAVDNGGLVVAAPIIRGYENISWNSILGDHPQVFVIGDGQASALGTFANEFIGRCFCLTTFVVGTGIGGGTVVDGRLLRGEDGYAGLFGHTKIRMDGDDVCICGRIGCVENYGSGRALAQAFNEGPVATEDVNRVLSELNRLLARGDLRAREIFAVGGQALGLAIGDIANALNPGIVAVGGGVLAAADDERGNVYFENAATTALETATPRVARNLRVVRMTTSYPNLIGAVAYADQLHQQPRIVN